MNNISLLEDETLEDLQLRGLSLIQKKQGFRFGMDSVLLASFAKAKTTDTVVDFGCGTGILPLLMIGRDQGNKYIGLEIQEKMAEMARRTMQLNHLEERVQIICADIAKATDFINPCSVEVVVCNPPYGMPGQVLRNQKESIATARHQEQFTLSHFFNSAFRILRGKGKLFLVYPAAQMFSLMTELHRNHLEPKRFRLVYPDVSHPANLVLMEAVKDAKPRLHPMPPLIIYKQNRTLTNELKSIYHIKNKPDSIIAP